MVSPNHENHFSRGSMLGRNFLIRRGFGMIASKKRLRRILNPTSKDMERRTWPWFLKPIREKKRVPRATMRGKPHSWVRRRT
jgi:hypothetical protein